MSQFFRSCFLLLLVASLSSCVYNNEEDLFPNTSSCDTTTVSFTAEVFPILEANCTGCHSGAFPSGNLDLTTHANVLTVANDGRLVGVTRWLPNFSKMPDGEPQLPACNLDKIEAWVNQGALNN
ncbi:MAG: hypothetical protein AAFR61_25245 [Bacteroidota bacterium]